MKRIAFAALALSLCSCQTAVDTSVPKDYGPRADADIAKYTITDNDVYGFKPESQFDPGSVSIMESRKDQDWTIYKVPDQKTGFDSVELTVDGSGMIIRLRFFKLTHTSVGRREIVDTAYQDLKSKYKAVQRIGDFDTADLTVYVADNEAAWKERYIAYLQLMAEPDKTSPRSQEDFHLGAQLCWILHPHLSQIQAIVRKAGQGATLVIDFQTKAYARAVASRTPPEKPSPQEN
jgi:hypothetical protein